MTKNIGGQIRLHNRSLVRRGSHQSETATTDTAAFEILREVTKYVTPDSPINF
jgi:hypothetical protein